MGTHNKTPPPLGPRPPGARREPSRRERRAEGQGGGRTLVRVFLPPRRPGRSLTLWSHGGFANPSCVCGVYFFRGCVTQATRKTLTFPASLVAVARLIQSEACAADLGPRERCRQGSQEFQEAGRVGGGWGERAEEPISGPRPRSLVRQACQSFPTSEHKFLSSRKQPGWVLPFAVEIPTRHGCLCPAWSTGHRTPR